TFGPLTIEHRLTRATCLMLAGLRRQHDHVDQVGRIGTPESPVPTRCWNSARVRRLPELVRVRKLAWIPAGSPLAARQSPSSCKELMLPDLFRSPAGSRESPQNPVLDTNKP